VAPVRRTAPALVALALFAAPAPAAEDAESIARLAMSTASALMMAEHEHEVEEALEDGNFAEALEEAEELVPWMKGVPWRHELMEPVQMATEALETLVARLEAQDQAGAQAAFEKMEKTFHHLHHELMEIAGGGNGH
jgi:predicted xylose isomerase-like sugar epimerase